MKSPLSRVLSSAFGLLILLIINGCGKTDSTTPATIPVITTNSLIVNLTTTGAQSGGIVTSNGGADITAAGVCYSSTNQTPTTANLKTVDSLIYDIAGTKGFTSTMTGLTPGTTYYLRAYAINSAGTAYGAVVKFTSSTTLTAVNTTVTTLAGSSVQGYLDGAGTAAQFYNPQGVAADAQGNVYVADGFNNRIREVSPAGAVTTFAGDGNAGFETTSVPVANAEFYAPQGIAIDGQGNIYIADLGNNAIRKISGGVVTTIAGNGTRGYTGAAGSISEFNSPQSICINSSGTVYVADRGNNVIRQITSADFVSTFAGSGVAFYYDATGRSASFNAPNGVVCDASGNVFVADRGNYCIRKITPAGVSNTRAGGPIQTTLIGSPNGEAIDSKGNLYITDATGRILEITTDNVLYVLAGSYNSSGYVDGPGATAKFNNPQGITIDNNGNIYVADYGNNVIRKITGAIQ